MEAESKPGSAQPIIALLFWLTVAFAAGFVGSQASFEGLRDWYPMAAKPSFTPPNWVFGPVWTVLYAMMGVAAWQVSQTSDSLKGVALGCWVVQAVLNALWSWLFFGWRNLAGATVECGVLAAIILVTAILFLRIRSSAGWLMVPYFLWVCFATFLTFSFWQLNR